MTSPQPDPGPNELASPVTPKGRRTRDALLTAGAVVAERDGLSELSVAAVAREARVAKGTFYVYFNDRESFIDAMHQRFYAQVTEAVSSAVEGLQPGSELLLSAIEAYLDVCLTNRAVKALVFETRARSSLTTTMVDREHLFAALAEPSMRAIGLGPASITARLVVALTSEAALIEMEAARKVPGARRAIRTLLSATASVRAR
ncbi:MAG: TetR/AcrR family transcriptional regulator [Solirubrobacterales bacterium]|nr:TetR/AcrR family transcriptional regulator [Solirubrobacterales bacterium]